jgi:MYXO-CTERM domain-containing protein
MNDFQLTSIASIAPAMLVLSTSQAGVIVDQPISDEGVSSQHFPDNPGYTNQAFDDFSLDGTTDLSALTIFGIENGNPAYNTSIVMRISSSVGFEAPVLFTATGTQVGSNLVFNLTGIQLEAGHYWLSAFVDRPFTDGGQWGWGTSSTQNGEHAMWQNPGGAFALGSAPVLTSALGTVDCDLAFTLEGTAVPTPGALALLGAVGLVGARRRRA